MRGELGISRRGLPSLLYVLHPDSAQRGGEGSMVSIVCIQGQGEESRGRLVLVPISEGIPQDVLESFGVQENLNQMLEVEQSIQLYSGEMREFLPSHLGGLDWFSGERSLSGHLVQSLESGFAIHLRIGLSEEEGDTFLGALGVYKMEEAPVVEMEEDMEVVDAEFECRD